MQHTVETSCKTCGRQIDVPIEILDENLVCMECYEMIENEQAA